MDALTTTLTRTLISTMAAAAQTLVGGIATAASEDAWQHIKARLSGWIRLDERNQTAAFTQAVQQALAIFHTAYPHDPQAAYALNLLSTDTPEGCSFRQSAVEELVFSADPNLGRLLDEYRRHLRWLALLRQEEPPTWMQIEPPLRLFLEHLLPQALANQPDLRPFLLEQAELQTLAVTRRMALASESNADTLSRIEALLQELVSGPRSIQQISATDGSSVAGVHQILAQNYYAAQELAAPDLEALFRRYRVFLLETYSTLTFRGIVQMQNVVSLPFEEVYVPLTGTASSDRSIRMPAADPRMRDAPYRPDANEFAELAARTESAVLSLHCLIRDTPFLVVLGDPGVGKSTLVRFIMLALAAGEARQKLGLVDEWLPIFFPIAAFAEARGDPGARDLAPLDYLHHYYAGLSQPDYLPLFRRALLSGRALVLFDGLDEVRTNRQALVHCLDAFVREWDAFGNRFVATSRIAGYDDAPLDKGLFLSTTVQPFTDDDIQQFAIQWSQAYEQAGMRNDTDDPDLAAAELQRRAQVQAQSLTTAIFANAHVTDLARNPLLLTILALIHNQGMRLPDRRVELYRLCVEALAETWNRARSLSGREISIYLDAEPLDERFVVNLLGPAALWIHAENPGGLIEQADLEQHLAETLTITDGLPRGKAQRLASDFVNLVRLHTGLLQERGHRRYGFLHLTFEEYLAARALLESSAVADPDALIQQRCTDPGWREVVRLTVAAASQREARRLLLNLLAAPTTAATHGRPVVLAGECLLDIGRVGQEHAWNAVTERLVALLADPQVPRAIRVEGGYVLGQLGDPRLPLALIGLSVQQSPRWHEALQAYWCPISAGPFWYGDDRKGPLQPATLPYDFQIARYPVTNADFARFIAAGGYADPRWWTDHGWPYLQPGGHDYPLEDNAQPITRPRLWDNSVYNTPIQPVVGVSWYEAVAYCDWLTAQGHSQGWLPTDQQIRLPTALEWERAARHTDRRRYPWGDAPPDAERANYKETGIGRPAPVGCFPQGRAVCGALDLAGNVMEWLATPSGAEQQVQPQKDFTPGARVLRTYSDFTEEPENLCCGSRFGRNPYVRNNYRGFSAGPVPALIGIRLLNAEF